MCWIFLAVQGGFMLLLFLARRERPPDDIKLPVRLFYKAAIYLYKQIGTRFPRLFSSARVEADLARLHPAQSRQGLRTDYYVKKLALCLALAVAGVWLGGAAHLAAQGNVVLGEGGRVPRGSFRQGPTEITVAVDFNGRETVVRVPVEYRRLSGKEAEDACRELVERLPELMRRDNADLDHVSTDLNLQSGYEGYPFLIKWVSSDPGTVSGTGEVSAGEEPSRVTLSAEIRCEEFERTQDFILTVRPPQLSEEERQFRELEKLALAAEESSRAQDSFVLPGQWQGEKLVWRQVVKDDGLLIWLAAVSVSAAVYFLSDRDLHSRLEKRKGALKKAYPELLHKLALYVGAGMTVRGALQKIAADYVTNRRVGAEESPVCEELLYTCRELRSGVSEGAAYEHFGRRIGMQEYIRLSTLLARNLKKGNGALPERLREEADRASEERLQQSRKLGEEAGTRLLLPMVMLLAVVMVMIIIPAFSAM